MATTKKALKKSKKRASSKRPAFKSYIRHPSDKEAAPPTDTDPPDATEVPRAPRRIAGEPNRPRTRKSVIKYAESLDRWFDPELVTLPFDGI